jgi:alkylation response protein AidB-like acyl-CoA dehydrogenase
MSESKAKALYGLDPESRQMVIDTVGQLRKKMLSREKVMEWDHKEIFPEEVIREMLGPEIGLQLLMIPEQYGGMGGGARDSCVITREMSKICLGITTAFFAIQLGADPLVVGGTAEQKAKWLGKIADGDTLVAYAVTEPGAGSNVAAIKAKAEPVKNDAGEVTHYKINGTKQFISTGGAADFITLLAKTPEGPTFFVVEKGTKGFQVGRSEEKHGIRASQTSVLNFEDVLVPVENLIGGIPGKGLKQANAVFGYTRLMVAAMGLGAGEAALDIAIGYAKERVVSGSTLSEKQGYTHKLIVPHVVRLAAAAAYIEHVAERLDAGEKELQVEGSIAKYFATDAGNRAAEDCIQALGGYGYINEFEVEKIKRDVKITCIYEGANEVQQNIISTFRWKTAVKTKGGYFNDIAEDMQKLAAEDLDAGCQVLATAARALSAAILSVHAKRLTRQQYIMFTLADMIANVEAGAALAHRAVTSAAAKAADAEKRRLASKLFAAEVAQVVTRGLTMILIGSGSFEPQEVADFMETHQHNALINSAQNQLADMDRMADIIFER